MHSVCLSVPQSEFLLVNPFYYYWVRVPIQCNTFGFWQCCNSSPHQLLFNSSYTFFILAFQFEFMLNQSTKSTNKSICLSISLLLYFSLSLFLYFPSHYSMERLFQTSNSSTARFTTFRHLTIWTEFLSLIFYFSLTLTSLSLLILDVIVFSHLKRELGESPLIHSNDQADCISFE